jgi:hypothetical protein
MYNIYSSYTLEINLEKKSFKLYTTFTDQFFNAIFFSILNMPKLNIK